MSTPRTARATFAGLSFCHPFLAYTHRIVTGKRSQEGKFLLTLENCQHNTKHENHIHYRNRQQLQVVPRPPLGARGRGQ
jgi:hypothetical protein